MIALPVTAAFALASVCVASSMSSNESRAWLSSTSQVVLENNPNAMIELQYVRVRGTNVAGYLVPATATHGFLENGQEVVAIPLGSGGSMGVIAALIFTVVDGRKRFVGYVPSPNGHLALAIREGKLEQSTPIYRHDDPTCCPGHERVEVFTLKGIRLVKIDERIIGTR